MTPTLRAFSNLIPALIVAAAVLAASALITRTPRPAWAAFAAPVVLAAGLLVADLRAGRRVGRPIPSAGAVIMAFAILVACAIVASDDVGRLAAMVPIFGGCAVLPVIRRESRGAGSR